MSIKVILAIGSPKAGGAEMFFVRLVTAIFNSDIGLEILPIVRRHSWVARQLCEAGVPHKTALFGGLLDFTSKRIIKRQVAEFRPDIIQTFMNRASRFIPKTRVSKIARLGGYYNLKYYQNMDYLVGNTQDICEYLINESWPSAQVKYLPNFVPEPAVNYRQQGQKMRKKLGVGVDKYVVLVAGRLHINKGVDTAIKSLKQLPSKVHLLVVGEGPEKENLQILAKELGVENKLTFAGWVDDISTMAAAADLWLVASRHEPLGNTILDAWAHKMPLVATRVAGPLSLIIDGESGLLVEPEGSEKMATAIETVMENKHLGESLVEKGYKEFTQKFSARVVLQQYFNFYKEVTNAK